MIVMKLNNKFTVHLGTVKHNIHKSSLFFDNFFDFFGKIKNCQSIFSEKYVSLKILFIIMQTVFYRFSLVYQLSSLVEFYCLTNLKNTLLTYICYNVQIKLTYLARDIINLVVGDGFKTCSEFDDLINRICKHMVNKSKFSSLLAEELRKINKKICQGFCIFCLSLFHF